MKKKNKSFSIGISIVLMLAINIQSCQKPPQKLILSSDKEMLAWNDSLKFESDPFKKKIRSVIYLKPDAISEIKRWIPYINKYPEVAFLFYINSTDRENIIESLIHLKFPIPVFLDTESEYKNYLLIAFIINEKNEIIALSNPSLSNFEATLNKIIKSE